MDNRGSPPNVGSILILAMMMKAIISGAHSPDPFSPVDNFILEMEKVRRSSL